MLIDRFIQARDSIINRFIGVQTDLVLNASRIDLHNFSGRDVAAEVKMAMDQFKMAAVDENGYQVNYAELRGSRAYDEYRNYCTPRLRNFDPAQLNTSGERLAFWINLYNALVIDGIINFDVQSSITETRLGIFSFFRKAAYNLGGKHLSLEDIEHGLLRLIYIFVALGVYFLLVVLMGEVFPPLVAAAGFAALTLVFWAALLAHRRFQPSPQLPP